MSTVPAQFAFGFAPPPPAGRAETRQTPAAIPTLAPAAPAHLPDTRAFAASPAGAAQRALCRAALAALRRAHPAHLAAWSAFWRGHPARRTHDITVYLALLRFWLGGHGLQRLLTHAEQGGSHHAPPTSP